MIKVDSQAVLTASTGTTNTVAFTNTAGNILFVGFISTANDVTGVTYNGVTMTQIGSTVQIPTSIWVFLFYLVNPATGTHNVVVSTTGSDTTGGSIVSYSNAIGTIDVNGTATASSATSISKSLTTTIANDWMVAFCATDGGIVSAGASTTLRQAADNTNRAFFDSNTALAIGNNTLNVNFSSSNVAISAAAFSPKKSSGFIIGEI